MRLIIQVITRFFKPFILLLMRRRRMVRPWSEEGRAIAMEKLESLRVDPRISSNMMASQLAKASEKDMRRQVRRASRKGRDITVKDLLAPIEANKRFLNLCVSVGLSINFFKGLAENIIREREKSTKRR